jgi:hypothetical protein
MGRSNRMCGFSPWESTDPFQESKQDGVDYETPPNAKMFDPTFSNNTDIVSLAKRRLTLDNKQSAPQINVSFAGLAEVLQLQKPSIPITPSSPVERFRPKMTLEKFCRLYQLSSAIKSKLEKLGVTGPHALRFLSKDELRNDGDLLAGEVAEVRDAEARWMAQGDENTSPVQ